MSMKFRWCLFSVALIPLAACSSSVTWQEEVQLSDRRIIVIERETTRTSGGDDLAHGGSGSRPKERRIRLPHPDGSGRIIEWHSTKIDDRLWPENPLVLDVIGDRIIVMTAVPISATCDRYAKYVFANGNWTEEQLPEEFASHKTNLYLKNGPHMMSYVDIATKEKENKDIRYFRSLRQVGPRVTYCNG